MDNKSTNNARISWAEELERSPTFSATFTYVSHRFDSINKWINCKTIRNSYIFFNVAYPIDKLTELGVKKGDRITVSFKAVNRDPRRPACYRFTAVEVNKYTEVERTKHDEEVSKILHEDRDFYEQRGDYFMRTMNSHRGTFVRAVQDKMGERGDFYFDMKVRQEDGKEVSVPMAFRFYCNRYFTDGFNGREGKDFRLWINPGKTFYFFTEQGEDIIEYEKKEEVEQPKYFQTLFIEVAEEIKD